MPYMKILSSWLAHAGDPIRAQRTRRLAPLMATLVFLPWFLASAPLPAFGAGPYRIGTGDIIRIEATGLSAATDQYTTGPDGNISVPLIGTIRAEGRTIDELVAELSRKFSLVAPQVSRINASIVEYRSQRVFVLGAVIRPGKYSFPELPSVWDAIGEAGGPAPDAILSAVEVVGSDSLAAPHTVTIDIQSALSTGHMERIPRLRSGDTVLVPRGLLTPSQLSAISIFGAVAAQGSFPAEQAPDLMSALVRSGGPSPNANLSRIEIIRKTSTETVHLRVDFQAFLDKGSASGNPPLRAGDTVYLAPTRTARVYGVLRNIALLMGAVGTFVALTNL